jgi:uncharacterized membrane protein YiaA
VRKPPRSAQLTAVALVWLLGGAVLYAIGILRRIAELA